MINKRKNSRKRGSGHTGGDLHDRQLGHSRKRHNAETGITLRMPYLSLNYLFLNIHVVTCVKFNTKWKYFRDK